MCVYIAGVKEQLLGNVSQDEIKHPLIHGVEGGEPDSQIAMFPRFGMKPIGADRWVCRGLDPANYRSCNDNSQALPYPTTALTGIHYSRSDTAFDIAFLKSCISPSHKHRSGST